MSFKIYINNVVRGDYHIGCFVDKSGSYYRTLDKNQFGRITSSIRIILFDDQNVTWAEIEKAVDEAYSKIPTLYRDTIYNETTSNGEVEIFSDGFFAIDPISAKKELHNAVNTLIARGRDIKIL